MRPINFNRNKKFHKRLARKHQKVACPLCHTAGSLKDKDAAVTSCNFCHAEVVR